MNVLAIDIQGIYVEQCAALSNKGKNTVRYYTAWESSQKFEDYCAGLGFEGLEKVLFAAEHYEWADLIFAPDVTGQDTIAFLRKIYPKKSIWGAGMAFKLEQDRWGLKKVLRDIGIKTSASEKIKGVTKLREYLKKNKDKYIKINVFRGSQESFYAKDYAHSEMILDEIESAFGPMKENYEFIVESAINTEVEIGADLIFNGNDYLKPYIYGYEVHKGMYFGKATDKLPPQLEKDVQALKPVLKKLDYRSCISTEQKIVSKTESYFLDITCRLPNPLCAIYNEYIENWPEVVYKVGLKQDVKLDIKFKYFGSMPLNSYHGQDYWLALDVKEEDRAHVKFYCVTKDNGKYYSVRGTEKAAIIVYAANTIDEVIAGLKKYTSKISAYGLDKDSVDGIDKIKNIIAEGKKVGIDF